MTTTLGGFFAYAGSVWKFRETGGEQSCQNSKRWLTEMWKLERSYIAFYSGQGALLSSTTPITSRGRPKTSRRTMWVRKCKIMQRTDIALRNVIGPCLEFRKLVLINFVELRKAFDSTGCESLWSIPRMYSIPQPFVEVFKKLYKNCCGGCCLSETRRV